MDQRNFSDTLQYAINRNREQEIRDILTAVYEALVEKGYNPISQIVGYILSEDPTYITNYNNARALIVKIDRDE
ncbi:MAG: IreB family regulatory phosphoprotein, partial [Clostridia bacterium]|nr:IreB family regulatory phosphoprotein [Clostridia bacterium]